MRITHRLPRLATAVGVALAALSLSAASASPKVRLLWADGASGRLRVEDGGKGGLPVVFVHGLGGSRAAWAEQLAHVRATRRAAALDLHGMGESAPSPSGDYSVESFASDVAAALEALRIERAVLVAHSLGGSVIGAFAARHPQRAAALLFCDPAGDLSHFPRQELEAQWLSKLAPESYDAYLPVWFGGMLGAARPEVREQVMRQVKLTPREVMAGAARSLAAYDPKPALEGFKGPMLTVVTPANQKPFSLQNLVSNLPARVIDGTSHWVMMDKPAEFDAAMDEFLATVK